MTSRRNFPEFQMGLGVISSAHNLITVVHTVRRKLHTTLNNICTVLTLTRIELRTPKSPYIQSVMPTFPLYHRGTQTFIMVTYSKIKPYSKGCLGSVRSNCNSKKSIICMVHYDIAYKISASKSKY
jgi:hypothetical protein